MNFFHWEDLAKDPTVYRPPVGGGGTLTGDSIEVGRYFYPKGHRPGRHSHLHEQIVTVFSGKLRVEIGGEERIVGPGEVFRAPSHVPHAVEVLEDSEFLSVKNLVGGKGSVAPRTWYEPPHGGHGLTDLELRELGGAREESADPGRRD